MRMRKRWLVLVAVGVATITAAAFGLDGLQGRMLGLIAGTTTDPRNASIRDYSPLSMEPVYFNLADRRAIERIEARELVGVDPYLALAVPQAYVTSIATQDFGPSSERDRVTFVQTKMLLNSDAPFELEWARHTPIVAEALGIRMPESPVDAQGEIVRRQPDFPDRETQFRFRDEMAQRGIIPVTMGFSNTLGVPEIEQRRHILGPIFNGHYEDLPWRLFEHAEGCVASPGPFPNSVRYDHAPDVLAAIPTEILVLHTTSSCLATQGDREAYAVIQYDENDELLWAMICQEVGAYDHCFARFLWNDRWGALVGADQSYVLRMPEFIERTDALFQSFHQAALADDSGR